MIVQAIGLLDDLDKELNTYAMRVREWYGWHFPEMTRVVTDNLQYAKTVRTPRRARALLPFALGLQSWLKHMQIPTRQLPTKHIPSLPCMQPANVSSRLRRSPAVLCAMLSVPWRLLQPAGTYIHPWLSAHQLLV